MDAKTLKALKGSIEKWKKIESMKALDKQADNCTLCQLVGLKQNIGAYDCESCLVFKKTHCRGCMDTPYEDWHNHHLTVHGRMPMRRYKDCPKCLELATAERVFLESLLPKEGK